jgi:hypothetical protein
MPWVDIYSMGLHSKCDLINDTLLGGFNSQTLFYLCNVVR